MFVMVIGKLGYIAEIVFFPAAKEMKGAVCD
jgi:hypothetical protein